MSRQSKNCAALFRNQIGVAGLIKGRLVLFTEMFCNFPGDHPVMRSLAFLIVGFALAVVLPNEIGTHDLPAIGGQKIAASPGTPTIGPSKRRPAAIAEADRRGAVYSTARARTLRCGVLCAGPFSVRLRT